MKLSVWNTIISVTLVTSASLAPGKSNVDPITKAKITYGVALSDKPSHIRDKLAGSSFIDEVKIKSGKNHHYEIEVSTYDFDSQQNNAEKVKRAMIYSFVTAFAVSNLKNVSLTFLVKRYRSFQDKKPRSDKPNTFVVSRNDVDAAIKGMLSNEGIFTSTDLWVVSKFDDGSTIDVLAPEYDNLVYDNKKPGLTVAFNSLIRGAVTR